MKYTLKAMAVIIGIVAARVLAALAVVVVFFGLWWLLWVISPALNIPM